MAYDKLFEHLYSVLKANGFSCERNKTIEAFNIKADLYAIQKGRTLRILPFCDYIFAYAGNYSASTLEEIDREHQKARSFVDTLYKWPKAFRFSVPNIASIFISFDGYTEDVKALAQKNTKTFIGGEVHGIYLVDIHNFYFISQGSSYVNTTGAIPQNRMFHLLNPVAEYLFKNKHIYGG